MNDLTLWLINANSILCFRYVATDERTAMPDQIGQALYCILSHSYLFEIEKWCLIQKK